MNLLLILALQAPVVCDSDDIQCRLLTLELELQQARNDHMLYLEREEWMDARVAAYEVEAELSRQDRETEGREDWIDIIQTVIALAAAAGAGKLTVDKYRGA